MEAIKHTLFTNWHIMRWMRLGFGLFLAAQAIQLHDAFSAIVAAFFLFQAVTNTGCFGSAGCATPTPKTNANANEDVHFEEVTQKKSDH
jgi:hypothetical protein